ncbi:MAG: histidine phosphatase family protein [Anaerolineales bacterium]
METPSTIDHFQFTILRHGESTANANGIHQGQHDFPLSPKGILQAQEVAQYFNTNKQKFDYIISSPLQRARKTAEIIAAKLDLPLELDEIWMERDAGVLSGIAHEEALKQFPRPEFIGLYDKIGKTGESQWDLYLRAGHAVNQLIHRPFGRYLIVSHGALINMVLHVTLGIFPQPNFHGAQFVLENTSIAQLNFYPQTHNWVLQKLIHPPYL